MEADIKIMPLGCPKCVISIVPGNEGYEDMMKK